MIGKRTALVALAAIATSAAPAHAAVTISTAATQNMNCSGGTCTPTASNAVLNVTDLENLLASGNVSVVTTNGSIQANNIYVTAPFSWSTANALTLDAYRSITFSAVVRSRSTARVSLITDDGGTAGSLTFAIGHGRLDTNAVSINGKKYEMATSVKQLAEKIVAKPTGDFALSKNIYAKKDGVYSTSPIQTLFYGNFNGLGHQISALEIDDLSDDDVGLFAEVRHSRAVITSVSLLKAVVRGNFDYTGAMVGLNYGTVTNSYVNGTVHGGAAVGGIAGFNLGNVSNSQSDAAAKGDSTGSLVGLNGGMVALSFASGKSVGTEVGGLIGENEPRGKIVNSYALGASTDDYTHDDVGGLVGFNYAGSIGTSYSIGAVSGRSDALVGGFDGENEGTIANSYWDTETSGQDQGSGDGNETGLTGLTTQQFQSGLPAGFDPNIWTEDAKINNGFPYLINNPPPK